MDRLTKALEKARADRAAVLQPGAHAELVPASDSVPNLPQPRDTRVRPVDPEQLAACRVLANSGQEAALSAFKLLRTQVLQRMRSSGWQVLAVTSPSPGNGKTVTSINLAINLARQAHQDVLLIDLDLRHPSVHKCLCAEPVLGISDYISGNADISEILFSPSVEGLTVLPGREAFSHSAEALVLPRTVSLVRALRRRDLNGLLILDMPPVLAADDVMAFSQHWDAALLVVEEGRTTAADLRRTLELLKTKPILGTVLTKSREALPAYGY